MENDTIKTYCKRNPRKELRRNPFDDLLPDQRKDVLKVFGWENTKHAGDFWKSPQFTFNCSICFFEENSVTLEVVVLL